MNRTFKEFSQTFHPAFDLHKFSGKGAKQQACDRRYKSFCGKRHLQANDDNSEAKGLHEGFLEVRTYSLSSNDSYKGPCQDC